MGGRDNRKYTDLQGFMLSVSPFMSAQSTDLCTHSVSNPEIRTSEHIYSDDSIMKDAPPP